MKKDFFFRFFVFIQIGTREAELIGYRRKRYFLIIRTEFSDVLTQRTAKYADDEVYGSYVKKVAKATENTYGEGKGSPPIVIARTVSKAVSARRPKTRYVAGSLAYIFVFLKKITCDKLFDSIVMSQVNGRS